MLPIGGLQVLKMVGLCEVQRLEILCEDDNGVSDEEMSKVRGEEIVHSAIDQSLFDVLVNDQVGVKILRP